jgi:hypothetical protein
MLQAAGQISYESMTSDEFDKFINTTARQLAHTMADNLSEENPGSAAEEQFAVDAKNFITLLNQRLADYAEFNFVDGEPDYPALRFCGNAVEELMGASDNKWISAQVMDVESPVMIRELKRGLSNILAFQDDKGNESS